MEAGSEISALSKESQSCPVERPKDPCALVILGASGDLTARKLLPALFRLYVNGGLPERFLVVGCGRTPWDPETFKAKMREAVGRAGIQDQGAWEAFAARLSYQPVEYDDPAAFEALANDLGQPDSRRSSNGNRIFYLAIPPLLYPAVAERLGDAGLAAEGEGGNGWSRIVVEKPFGRDLDTARELDGRLNKHFREHQIFRIDHYLAKETVQNVLLLRFANAVFEPIWNRRYVARVAITAAETLGVGHRAGYYEQTGVLRDMFQNHMMQLLALVAMEPPPRFEPEAVRDEKAKVFRSLRPFSLAKLRGHLVLGQYEAGDLDGVSVAGYRQEPGVARDSLMPTFAMMKIFVDNWRWQGVPFLITSGKRMARKTTSIVVQFREVPHSMFSALLGERILANRLTFGIYPHETITLTFQAKEPGPQVCMRSVPMRFDYHEAQEGPQLDAYEKVLLDCIHGDQMLFWRQDSVELCWDYLTPILGECEACVDQAEHLYPYEAGSWGPAQAGELIADLSFLDV